MERKHIIKSLEWCFAYQVTDCSGCAYKTVARPNKRCMDALMEDAHSLIKELIEENRMLKGGSR